MEHTQNIQESIEDALTETESQNNNSDEPSSFDIMQAVIIAVAIILVFYTGARVGTLTNSDIAQTTVESVIETSTTSSVMQTTQTAVIEQTTNVVVTEEITIQDGLDSQDTQDSQEDVTETVTEAVQENVMPSTTQEILDLFNTSANNVKVNASEVIRNYELVSHDESKLSLPSALQSIGSSLISQLVVDDMTSITYTEEQDFIDHFPVSGGFGNVNVTTADISNATITDDGDTYTVVLSFNECYDPVDTGVGSAFSLVTKDFVMSITSIIKDCSFYYYDCEITAIIDKDTGNLIEANYYMPVAYSITASMLVTLNATVATIVETNYSVNY